MSFSPFYIIAILVLGVLFFGKNLPDVARQIGTALMEFRSGLNDWKETHSSSSNTDRERKVTVREDELEERFESLGTKFEPPSEGA